MIDRMTININFNRKSDRYKMERLKDIPHRGNLDDSYKIIKELGFGAMGIVYLVEGVDGEQFALKQLTYNDPRLHQQALKEYLLIRRLGPVPNLVEYRDLFYAQKGGEMKLFILMNYYPGESLFELLDTSKIELPDIVQIIDQLLEVVRVLHRNGFIHGDIKTENIIYSRGEATLIDPGMACAVRGHLDTCDPMMRFGTSGLISPELVYHNICDQPVVIESLPASDLWSLGLVFWSLLLGYSIEQDLEEYLDCEENLDRFIVELRRSDPIGIIESEYPVLDSFVQGFLEYDYKRRITASEAQKIFVDIRGFL